MLVTLQRSMRASIKRAIKSSYRAIMRSIQLIDRTCELRSIHLFNKKYRNEGKVERKAYVKRHHAADGLRDTKCHQKVSEVLASPSPFIFSFLSLLYNFLLNNIRLRIISLSHGKVKKALAAEQSASLPSFR